MKRSEAKKEFEKEFDVKLDSEINKELTEIMNYEPLQLGKELKKIAKKLNCPVSDLKQQITFLKNKHKKNKSIEKENIDYSEKQINNSFELFNKENLLKLIEEEITKYHFKDKNLKMTTFLTSVSSLLNNPKRRMSLQITGKTAEGKDNLMKAVLRNIPKPSFKFITSGTQAVLEDDLKDISLLVISEINLFKDFGANKHLLEVIKQRTEGGVTAVKKDLREQNQEVRVSESEQQSVIFGTTDVETDEELNTRVMKGTIKSSPEKIKFVNENTFDLFSNENLILKDSKESDNFIRIALTEFQKNKNIDIVIPYAELLKQEINGESIFDYQDPRSQRDVKRLLSLTCAMTYLFQSQRKKKVVGETTFIISEVEDFINTLKYSNVFFNQTYMGFDARLNSVIKFIEEQSQDWVDKKQIQDFIGVSKNTINEYCRNLSQEGVIEGSKGVQLNEQECMKIYDGNRIYYKRVQKEFKKSLVRVQIEDLENFLNGKRVQKRVQNEDNIEKTLQKQQNIDKKEQKNNSLDKIEPFELNPLEEEDQIEVVKI